MPQRTLLMYAENRYSQNGEDGVLAEIFKRLGISEGWFVEFGAWDGKHLSNTFALLEDGWSGVGIEGEVDRYADLVATAKNFGGRLHALNVFIDSSGDSSLDRVLKDTPVPEDLDLLSIDIDSYDYWVWMSVQDYRPKVVVIEINSSFPVGTEYVQSAGPPDGGASFTSMLKLGQHKGYTLVCHTGNLIFVRNDLAADLALAPEEINQPNGLFLDSWIAKPTASRWRMTFAPILQRLGILEPLRRARALWTSRASRKTPRSL
jgi:hypothetical protein